MNNNVEPYVFILDLDGTIIGDCRYQCDIYNIQEIIKKNSTQKLLKNNTLCEKSLCDSYNNESLLIRPFFNKFMLEIKKQYPNSFIYIYTASEKSWAHKEISIIEKQNNIKFNRPIFTRNNCIIDQYGVYKKSVVKILPLILKSMKMPKTYDISKKLLIIDNNDTFVDYTENLLICSTYNYIKFNDLWDNIPEEYLENELLKTFVSSLISSKKIHNIRSKKSEVQDKVHKWLYKKYKKINKFNYRFRNDTFWKDLITHIKTNNIQEYNKHTLYIMKKSIKI